MSIGFGAFGRDNQRRYALHQITCKRGYRNLGEARSMLLTSGAELRCRPLSPLGSLPNLQIKVWARLPIFSGTKPESLAAKPRSQPHSLEDKLGQGRSRFTTYLQHQDQQGARAQACASILLLCNECVNTRDAVGSHRYSSMKTKVAMLVKDTSNNHNVRRTCFICVATRTHSEYKIYPPYS